MSYIYNTVMTRGVDRVVAAPHKGRERIGGWRPNPHLQPRPAPTTKLKLDPPDVLQPVAPAEAAGLVPLKTEETSELDKRVAQFVDELAGLDSNSPEFGKKVDQLTAMGRKEIAEAAGASNRFLDRPVKAIDKDSGIGADLTELRRTVEGARSQGRRPRPASSSGSSRSATGSTAISTNTEVRRRTSRRSSAALPTARTSF